MVSLGPMFDGRMPFEVPHALDGDSQEFQSGLCDFVSFEVYGYKLINGGFCTVMCM